MSFNVSGVGSSYSGDIQRRAACPAALQLQPRSSESVGRGTFDMNPRKSIQNRMGKISVGVRLRLFEI